MAKDIGKAIGQRIQQRRKELGLSQEELAALCSCHRTYIGMVERAEKNISVIALSKLAKGLGTDMSTLLAGL